MSAARRAIAAREMAAYTLVRSARRPAVAGRDGRLAMMHRRWHSRWLGGGLLLPCLLAFAILLAHQALMTTAHHARAVVMGQRHEFVAAHAAPLPGPTVETVAPPAPGASVEEQAPHAPHPTFGDCRIASALLPLFLLLVLVGACSRPGRLSPAAFPARWRGIATVLVPPLAPARRRALLQIFRN